MKSSEAYEQIALIDYCEYRHIPIFHIPNGGSRNKREAKNLKRQGVRAGVPDLFVPVARRGRHGLFIEMKSDTGRPTDKQLEWIGLLNDQGYMAVVCNGFESAKETVDWYFGGEDG